LACLESALKRQWPASDAAVFCLSFAPVIFLKMFNVEITRGLFCYHSLVSDVVIVAVDTC